MGFQRMNKKGFEFKSGLFAIIAVSLFVIAFGVIISEQATVYGSDAVSEIDVYNRLDNVSSIANSGRSSISPNDPDPGNDPEASTFRGVYGILTNIFTSFDIVLGQDGMIKTVTEQFGIPDYVTQGILTIILIGITFSLIAVIFRLARRSA